jgi:hypothetical protein
MAAKTSFYEQEENLQLLCNFLRSKEGPAVREALLMDKRVLYMKGKQMNHRGHENRHCLVYLQFIYA